MGDVVGPGPVVALVVGEVGVLELLEVAEFVVGAEDVRDRRRALGVPLVLHHFDDRFHLDAQTRPRRFLFLALLVPT